MAEHDGNGWVEGPDGSRRWGLHGAAGLLLARPGPEVLLQLRADWTHFGGTWSLVGGARDSHEDVVDAALREAEEEAGVARSGVEIVATLPGARLGSWSYTYVLGWITEHFEVAPRTSESVEIRWFPLAEVALLPLHEGLAADWQRLADAVLASAAQPGHPNSTRADRDPPQPREQPQQRDQPQPRDQQ